MKPLLLAGLLTACGGAQSQASPMPRSQATRSVAVPAVPAMQSADDPVDRGAGHGEPEEPDDALTPGSPSTSEQSTTGQVRRSREPEVSPDAPVLDVLEGRASYYSDRLAGRSTASGEPYRIEEFTAASRDLPFGTLVRVVRLSRASDEELGSVIVRVNDRGPFGDHRRILDLSRAAAEALDMVSAGVIRIRAEILRRGR